jgi:hypothetical protein
VLSSFVDNLEEALRIAWDIAGDGDINVAEADIVRQCLAARSQQERTHPWQN